MIEKVISIIKDNSMINNGDKIIVGVSGGPDSICLLHILYSLRESLGITLVAAHINHCLRGEEADRDEEYVKDFCSKIGIECYSKKIDIHKLSQQKGISCETAGREARYGYFNELLKKLHGQKIALAHNANDQAETVLMRIMRGTGMDGLVGIKPVRDNIIIRPLIGIRREEIEKYCYENVLQPRIDKTNLENIYNRNKVRLELIPYIEKSFNSDIITTLNRLAENIGKDNEYIEDIISKKYERYCEIKGDKVIINKNAFVEPYTIISRVIRMSILKLFGSLNNFERSHIFSVIELSGLSTGKKAELPGGIIALNSYGDIHIYKQCNEAGDEKYSEYKLSVNKINLVEKPKLKVSINIIPKLKGLNFSQEEMVKYFDYDKASGEIVMRFRKQGDRFTPLGMKGSRKLKDFFIDLKIPNDKRSEIPLICFGEEIAWIIGYRISDKYKIDNNTQNILEIKVESEEI